MIFWTTTEVWTWKNCENQEKENSCSVWQICCRLFTRTPPPHRRLLQTRGGVHSKNWQPRIGSSPNLVAKKDLSNFDAILSEFGAIFPAGCAVGPVSSATGWIQIQAINLPEHKQRKFIRVVWGKARLLINDQQTEDLVNNLINVCLRLYLLELNYKLFTNHNLDFDPFTPEERESSGLPSILKKEQILLAT